MIEQKLLVGQALVLSTLFSLVLLGAGNDAHWSTFWFSALAHFLGGVWVALFAGWGSLVLHLPPRFLVCVSSALLFGILWELFEVQIGATHFPVDTVDTIADLCMDVIGGSSGALALRSLWLRA